MGFFIFLFFGVCVVIGVLLANSNSQQTAAPERNQDINPYDSLQEKNQAEKWIALQNKYREELETHYYLLEKIENEYSIWYNMGMPKDTRYENLVKMCEADIAIAPVLKKYFQESGENLPSYGSFKRLSIIYEKLKEYEKSHEVCLRALSLGFVSEGQGKTVHSRIARLEKKRQ